MGDTINEAKRQERRDTAAKTLYEVFSGERPPGTEDGGPEGQEAEEPEEIKQLWKEIARLNDRIDAVNGGCRLCQKYMREELDKCQKVSARAG